MNLEEIRKKIDNKDEILLNAFLERMELSRTVAEYKKANSLPIYNKAREREILEDVMRRSGDMERYTHSFFSMIMELSKSLQSEIVSSPCHVDSVINQGLSIGADIFPRSGIIACQGVEGANSQEACDKLFPRGTLVYVKTFEAVFDAVESGLCNFGVLPIENSDNGSVRAVYELLKKHNSSIVRSIRLCIHHELLAKPGTKLSDITEIYSHEQALGQCSKYLSALADVKLIPCANTAVAAKLVSESEGNHRAAISSHRCAQLYNLEPVCSDIQNNDNNYTRFICITKKPMIYEGANRISLILACDNKPGGLYEILSKFAAMGINMSKLESCPVTGSNFEFIFFIEIEASVKEPGVISMLEELERCCETFVFLGNYSEV